jgi:uncharacterized protein YciI
MLFIVQFEDKPDMGELRDKLLQSHFAFLDKVSDRVLMPGSMRDVPGDKPVGGLWIIDAQDEAEVPRSATSSRTTRSGPTACVPACGSTAG